jgi:hypothetical protein
MGSPHKRTAGWRPGGCKGLRGVDESSASSVAQAPDQHQHKPLVDKFGNRHRESVLTSWSPAMLKIMRVRRIDEEGGAS